MVMTDPIADMLTRIRNANSAAHSKVEMPASKMKAAVLEILKEEGFVSEYELIEDNKQKLLQASNVSLNQGCAYMLRILTYPAY